MAGAYDMLARIGADISDFSRKMSQVTSKINEVARAAKGPLIGAGAILAPGAIPMVAALGAGAVAMGGSFAAAGVSMGAFGAVAVTTLGSVFEAQKKAAEAQKELNAATTDKEKEAALKKMEEAYAGLSDKQKEAAKSLQEFKTFWSGFAKQFETPVIDIFTKSLQGLKGIIEPMKRPIEETATAISELVDMFNQSLNTQPVQDFFTYLGDTAYDRTRNFGMMFGNTMRGITALMVAFDPLAASVEQGMVKMSASFAKWAEGLQNSKGFENFINYVKTNGPVMLSLFGNIIGIIKQIVVALAPFGAQVLAVAQSFTAWLNTALKTNPILLQISGILVGLGAAFLVLAPIIGQVVSFFTGFIGIITKVVNVVRLIPAALAMITSPIGLVVLAVVALIAIFVALWKTNEDFRNKVIEIWNMIYSVISTIITAVMGVIMTVWGQIKAFWDANQNEIRATAQVIWAAIGNAINRYLSMIQAVFKAVFPVLKTIVSSAFSVIQAVIKTVMSLVLGIIKVAMAVIRGDWQGAWNAIKATTSSVVNNIKNLVQTAFNGLKSIIQSVMNSVKGVVQSGWRAAQSFLEGIDLTSIGSNIIQGLIDGIGSKAGAVVSKIQDIAGGIKEKIMDAMQMHSPSRWMKNFVAGNMMKGWIIGIEAMRSKVLSMTETMTEWMQPQMPNLQTGYTVPSVRSGAYAGGTSDASNASGNSRGDTTVNVYARTVDMNEGDLMKALRRVEVLYG